MKNKKSMMLIPYILTITVCSAILIVIHLFVAMPLFNIPLWYSIVIVISSVLACILIDGILAAIFHTQVKKMKPFSKYFTVSKRERNFWIKLGVKKFKDYLPDLGVLVKFRKSSIENPKSKEYIYAYMQESCCGEIGHILALFLGYLVIFLFPLKFWLCYGLPIATINAILIFLPAIALRYNRYTLELVYKSLTEREQQTKDCAKANEI